MCIFLKRPLPTTTATVVIQHSNGNRGIVRKPMPTTASSSISSVCWQANKSRGKISNMPTTKTKKKHTHTTNKTFNIQQNNLKTTLLHASQKSKVIQIYTPILSEVECIQLEIQITKKQRRGCINFEH